MSEANKYREQQRANIVSKANNIAGAAGKPGENMPRHQIEDMPFDPELSPGAANAIHTCLNLQPEERITLVLGKECLGDRIPPIL